MGRFPVSLAKRIELANAHRAAGLDGDDFQSSTHGLNDLAEGAQIHFRTALYLRDRCLVHIQSVGQRFLCKTQGFAEFR